MAVQPAPLQPQELQTGAFMFTMVVPPLLTVTVGVGPTFKDMDWPLFAKHCVTVPTAVTTLTVWAEATAPKRATARVLERLILCLCVM